MPRKTTYPKQGTIKTTGDAVTVLGEGTCAGLKIYYVRFESGRELEWSREKVRIHRG